MLIADCDRAKPGVRSKFNVRTALPKQGRAAKVRGSRIFLDRRYFGSVASGGDRQAESRLRHRRNIARESRIRLLIPILPGQSVARLPPPKYRLNKYK